MNQTIQTILAALLLAAASSAAADEDDGKPPKIFTTDEVIAVTLEAPWDDISRQRRSDRTWAGTVGFTSANGRRVSIPVTISRRGLTRLRICDFPPLRLDFDKEASKGTEFRSAGNLKLVTHCFRQDRYAQYYIKEYLAYRIYNRVTPLSFRVQGLDIEYAEPGGQAGPGRYFGFLIEDPDDVAERNGMQKLDVEETVPSQLEPTATSRFMLFQYLIANLDWSVLSGPGSRCCHNARIVSPDGVAGPYYVIPYDLDSSGLVNAHYAAPPKNLRVRSVRQRLYRGFCAHDDAVPAALGEFRALRAEIMALVENEPHLDARNRSDAVRFLEGFYQYLEDDGDVQKRLIDNCRG